MLSIYFLKFSEVKGGPLSVLISIGVPNSLIALSKTGNTSLAYRDFVKSTIGYLEY